MSVRFENFLALEDATVINRFDGSKATTEPGLYYRSQSLGAIAWALSHDLRTFGDDPTGTVRMDFGTAGYFTVSSKYTPPHADWEYYQFIRNGRRAELARRLGVETARIPSVAMIVQLDPDEHGIEVTDHDVGKYYSIPETSALTVIDQTNRELLSKLFQVDL